jgi:uncharacterized protein (TIGR03086 family)
VTTAGLPAVLAQGVALLERAMGYTLGSLLLVTPTSLDNPTPCCEWDLRALLLHMNESLQALHEAIAVGHLELDPSLDVTDVYADYGDPMRDPVASLRNRACHMVGAWMSPSAPDVVSIHDRCVTADVVAAAGAIEVAVHGWDVAASCGIDRPIPEALAGRLIDLCDLFVDDTDRPHRFGPELKYGPGAAASEHLLARLGRAGAQPANHQVRRVTGRT